uniref:Uncharacterized protein n=1 Tax=Phlebotomus papatasi TaxID=29031 RepID=A0A1B0DHC5_PHLPP
MRTKVMKLAPKMGANGGSKDIHQSWSKLVSGRSEWSVGAQETRLWLQIVPPLVKCTEECRDQSGIVLTSMHKYKPRLHVIRTSEPSQIPWSPSQVFFFPDTDFVAVTAYQ